ncbi:MAG: ion transporter [Saprospiraceae bacterium]
MTKKEEQLKDSWRDLTHEIIFEADTFWGKTFDVALLVFIVGSVLAVMLETVGWIEKDYGNYLTILEWVFTIFFSVEYGLRLWCVNKPWKYATSFFGIIDLLAILPAYLSLVFVGTHYFIVIRAMRLLRVFRIFKLAHFLNESTVIMKAMRASQAKITVFLTFVILAVIVLGSLMYLIEGGEGSGFTSMPRSIYWAIVTLTTVGYGDIAPASPLGQFVAACIMVLGYAVLAVPTGIVSAEFTAVKNDDDYSTKSCPSCSQEGHDWDAVHCKFCGEVL